MNQEAQDNAAEAAEPTLEEFVASELEAEQDSEAQDEGTLADHDEQPDAGDESDAPEPEQTFEVQGEQVTIDELTKGYLRQQDYTKKTQEVARAREEAESIKAALERFYSEPAAPEWQPERGQPQPSEQGDIPEFATEAERRLWEKTQMLEKQTAELTQSYKRKQAQEQMQAIERTFDGFVEAHPDMPEQQIIEISRTVRERGLPYTPASFDLVSRAIAQPSIEEVRKAAVAEYIERQKVEKRKAEEAALEPGNAPAHDEPPPDIRKLPQETIDALMAQEFRNLGG